MRPCIPTIVLLVISCATRALSAQEDPGSPAELSQLSAFVGDWQCTGQVFARGSRPGHATAAAGHAANAIDGHWLQFAYAERKTSANPTPYHVAGYMGYDASRKQFVQTTVDNYGHYGPSYGDGWKGDTLTFEGTDTLDGRSRLVRDQFVRKGRHAFVHFSEAQGPDGGWLKPDQETCKLGTR
jgi:Protein of unknown function (DUF1579)